MTEDHTYSYHDLTIHYQKTGTGKPLVILHGWGSSSRVMMPVARQLADRRTCYVLDLPGFGATGEPPRAWDIGDYTDMVEAFMRAHLDGPADLLVHSFGGRITLKLCARPSGKKLVDQVLITGGAGMKPRRSFRFYLKKYTAKALKAPFTFLPPNLRDKALGRLRQTKLWKSLGSSDYSELSGVMRETFVKSVTEHFDTSLHRISHEVLLIWGRDDDATPLYQGRRMEQGMPNAALVEMERAGHYAFLDRPKHFASIARAFFRE